MRYSMLTLAVLIVGLGRLDAGEDEVGLRRVERSLAAINERLARLEKDLAERRAFDLGVAARRSNNAKNLIRCLTAIGERDFPRDKTGRVDLCGIVRAGVVEAHTAVELLRDERTGVGPSAAEIASGDHDRSPYDCGGRWSVPDGKKALPVFWERRPDREGKIFVAYNNGAVRRVDAGELRQQVAGLAKKPGR